MKKILKYIALAIILGACSDDFLDLNPPTFESTGDYYKTEEQFALALVGAYNPLRGLADPSGWNMGEMRSDNTIYDNNPLARSSFANYLEHVADFVDDETNSVTAQKWNNAYLGISRVNYILDYIYDANIPDAAKNPIIAESKFLRAFFYFDLVQFYGGVPLHLNAVENPDQAFLPRSSVDEVYVAIIDDLKDAIQKFSPTVSFPQSGRATIGSAKTLLANVFMVQQKFSEAEIILKEVTQLGYSLLPDYGSVYAPANKNSRESVFEIQYKQGNAEGQGSIFLYRFIPQMVNSFPITGHNVPTHGGSSGAAMNYPTQDLLNAYEPGDLRLDASIAVAEGVFSGDYFVCENVKSIVDYETPEGKISKLFIRKYWNPHSDPGSTDNNWPVYRYAEVLLFLAECLNEQGKSAEALPYLNQVRVPRTGLTEITETNQDLLRDIIAHERRIELAFENKRWTDLVRTGKALEIMTAFGNDMKENYPYVLWPNAYNITEYRLLFPIPRTELEINSQLVQNPGYAGG